MDTRVVGRKQKGIQGGGRGSFQVFGYPIEPLIGDFGTLRVDGNKINTGSGMSDIVEFRVETRKLCTVSNLFELLCDPCPRGRADVFKDHKGRPMLFDPGQHAAERLARLPLCIEPLFHVVQVGIVDTGGSSDQKIDIPWNGC
jgi:hypothetical protein